MKSRIRFAVLTAAVCTMLTGFAAADGGESWRFSDDMTWKYLDAAPEEKAELTPWIRPSAGMSVFQLDLATMKDVLGKAPREFTPEAKSSNAIINIPRPDGGYERFSFVESPIWEPGFELQNPGVMTYLGTSLDVPGSILRCDLTPAGFHASVLSPEGNFYVDPWWQGETETYSSYWLKDYTKLYDGWTCGFELPPDYEETQSEADKAGEKVANGLTLRQYRLACAATGEYTAFHGGTAALGQAAIVTMMNRVNQVYERDVCVRMNLVANNINLVYTSSGSDPYTNSDGVTMLTQNQNNVTTVIGSANYDIGHVVSTGGGGIAGLGVVCNSTNKARGVTGSPSPTGDAFWIDYVAHEMGHQWNCPHTFNGNDANCGSNRNAATAYEIGSGSTIMAYAGICSPNNLQSTSDDYFVHDSLEKIVAFTSSGGGSSCASASATGNNLPSVSIVGTAAALPVNTPFTLTATGSDADAGDVLTFCWDTRSLGAATSLAAADNGTSPINRSRDPLLSGSRTVPPLANIIANSTTTQDKYPSANRSNYTWRVYVRDNKAGGGAINSADIALTVTNTAGPFTISAPNTTGITWTTSPQTVTWNVANTNIAPVNVTNVRILLSTDGGNTFPTELVASTANDGTEDVTLPTTNSATCRIKVEAIGNFFWDMSNANFTINYTAPSAVAEWTEFDAAK